MFQRFYENTHFSRAVKNLLSTEPIPILQTVTQGQHILKGCRYIYDDMLILCTQDGPLLNNYDVDVDSSIITTTHVSKVSWYDDETHKYLGNYLRYLRDSRSIDLMRYYNCYNSMELADIYLSTTNISPLLCSNDKIKLEGGETIYKVTPDEDSRCGSFHSYKSDRTYGFGSMPGYKVLAVPVKFDTTYTIAIDSYNSIFLRGIIYNSNGMVEIDSKMNTSNKYYSDYLDYSCDTRACSSFNKPFEYRIDLASSSSRMSLTEEEKVALYSRQKDLYLVLQVPTSCTSSIVVLEGSYTNKHKRVVQGNAVVEGQHVKTSYGMTDHCFVPEHLDNNQQVVIYPDNLSLLHYNTGVSYAFSDRLVEYLLLNVVSPQETLPTNISRVQRSLSILYPTYTDRLDRKSAVYGVWDDAIQHYVTAVVHENIDKVAYPMDHDGYVNKDVESLLSVKGVYIT